MPEWIKTWYPALLAALGAALSAAVYDRLPATVAIHWNASGTPDGWVSRPVGAYFTPVFLLVLWAVLRVAPHLQPGDGTVRRHQGGYQAIVLAVLLLVLATHLVVIATALGYAVPVARVIPALVGALFFVIGTVMSRAPAGEWMGMRAPWVLSSEQARMRTRRLASSSMRGAGVAMVVAALVLPPELGLPVIVAAAVAAAVGPVVYSHLTSRRERKDDQHD